MLYSFSQEWEIKEADLTMHEVLGEGTFGMVYKATLRNSVKCQTVAVKKIKGEDFAPLCF